MYKVSKLYTLGMPDENTNPNPGRRLVRRYRSTNPLPTNRPQRTRDVLVVISDDEGLVTFFIFVEEVGRQGWISHKFENLKIYFRRGGNRFR